MNTNLMDKLFSDATPEEVKDAIADKIEAAKESGSEEYKDKDTHLTFTDSEDGVVIEDKKNDEVTVAVPNEDGTHSLKAVECPSKVEEGEKGFSVTYGPFATEDEARYFSAIVEAAQYTFSDEEVAEVAEAANDLENKANKLHNTESDELAEQVKDEAEAVKAYSILAQIHGGHDLSDVIEMCNVYSQLADEVMYSNFMDTPVVEYINSFSEEEAEDFVDNAHPEVLEAINDAVEAKAEEGETATFSDVMDVIEYYNDPMNQDFNQFFSDMTEEEYIDFMATFSEEELSVFENAFALSEQGETVTFSDINDALYEVNNMTFSDVVYSMDEDEAVEVFSDLTEGQLEFADAVLEAEAEGEQFNFSDVMRVLQFSEEDVEDLKGNVEELNKAKEVLKKDPDEELASKVKALADNHLEEVEVADMAGHDVKDAKEKLEEISKVASDVLEGDKVKVTESKVTKTVETPSGKVDFVKGLPTKVETSTDPTIDKSTEKMFSDTGVGYQKNDGKINFHTHRF